MRGWGELLLFSAVLAAAWTRTPLGAIGHNAVAAWQGTPTVDVLARFRTQIPDHLQASLEEAFAQLPPPAPSPTPEVEDRPVAAQAAIRAHRGEEVLPAIEALAAQGASLEAALEIHAVGADLRDRAIARARAAGEDAPEALAAHRRYLPAEAAEATTRGVEEVLALSTVLDLRWPVDPAARITSPFGERMHPTLHERRFHNGVDIGIPTGTPIYAAGDGKVSRAREDSVSGKYIVLSHGHGVTTSYCHGSLHRVEEGTSVAAGELILDSGSTGRSTGPHLHFTLKIGGRASDPLVFRPDPASEPPPLDQG